MTIAATSEKLQVFFDGACPMCSREVRHYKKRDRSNRIDWIDIAAENFDAPAYSLDPAQVQHVMHARKSDGRIVTGVAAFLEIWKALPPSFLTTSLLWLLKIPGSMPLARLAYRMFARNRYRLGGRCTPASCPTPQSPN